MLPWNLARRCTRMQPSAIREILALTEKSGVLSMAGGLPSPDSFPADALREACQRVLTDTPREALQYASSEGFAPLREWVADRLRQRGMAVAADQVLVTTGSQQGLDLVGKVLIDAGAPVAVEAPTYLGALSAFTPMEPIFHNLPGDAEGPLPEAFTALTKEAPGTRFAYLLPNFQNPTGRMMPASRRADVAAAAQRVGVPLLEDDPYGELWYDAPPPPALASWWPEGTVYLGSFSKVLAPGFRLGYVVAPQAIVGKLVQAKQAADLHSPGFNQRVVWEVVRDGFLDRHVPTIRERYRRQRDAMAAALRRHLPPGCEWQTPAGGMFFWLRLPPGGNATALLHAAVEAGVAFVPGAPFYAHGGDPRSLRLSFVTLSADQIEDGIAILGRVAHEHLEALAETTP
jgi:2-aminoadipate transaminase